MLRQESPPGRQKAMPGPSGQRAATRPIPKWLDLRKRKVSGDLRARRGNWRGGRGRVEPEIGFVRAMDRRASEGD